LFSSNDYKDNSYTGGKNDWNVFDYCIVFDTQSKDSRVKIEIEDKVATFSFTGKSGAGRIKMKKNNAEKNILYQTSNPSLMVIKRPNTPVKPAKKIAACN
jgi:hypothetical protein